MFCISILLFYERGTILIHPNWKHAFAKLFKSVLPSFYLSSEGATSLVVSWVERGSKVDEPA